MILRRTAAAAALVLGLAACEGGQGLDSGTIGTIGGAAGGGLIGSQIGSGTGQLAATAIGTLVGALAGREVGRQLGDEGGSRAASAERQALASNETITWNNPQTNAYGSVNPQNTYTNADGQLCRDYTHSITVNGRQETARGTACRQSDGTWRLMS